MSQHIDGGGPSRRDITTEITPSLINSMLSAGISRTRIESMMRAGVIPLRKDLSADEASRVSMAFALIDEVQDMPGPVMELYRIYLMTGAPVRIMPYMRILRIHELLLASLGCSAHDSLPEEIGSGTVIEHVIRILSLHYARGEDLEASLGKPMTPAEIICYIESLYLTSVRSR